MKTTNELDIDLLKVVNGVKVYYERNDFGTVSDDDIKNKLFGMYATDELYDDEEILSYDLQINYNFEEEKETANYWNEYIDVVYSTDLSIEDFLINCDIDSECWFESKLGDRDTLTQLLKLLAVTGDMKYLEEIKQRKGIEVEVHFDSLISDRKMLFPNLCTDDIQELEKAIKDI